jgi:hypothetical protein
MKKLLVMSAFVAGLGLATVGYADVVTLAPTQVAVIDDGNGNARVAVQFDLSGLREGAGRRIESAILDWTVEGAPEYEEANFAALPLTAAWDDEAIESELAELSVGESEAGSWVITPDEHENGLGGTVRMNITGTVSAWAATPEGNYGVVITTSAISAEALAEQASGIRLVVAYGFVAD